MTLETRTSVTRIYSKDDTYLIAKLLEITAQVAMCLVSGLLGENRSCGYNCLL